MLEIVNIFYKKLLADIQLQQMPLVRNQLPKD